MFKNSYTNFHNRFCILDHHLNEYEFRNEGKKITRFISFFAVLALPKTIFKFETHFQHKSFKHYSFGLCMEKICNFQHKKMPTLCVRYKNVALFLHTCFELCKVPLARAQMYILITHTGACVHHFSNLVFFLFPIHCHSPQTYVHETKRSFSNSLKLQTN